VEHVVPEGDEDCTGGRAQDVVRHEVGEDPANVADVAQDRVALLASGNEHAVRGGLLLLPLLHRCTKLLLLLLYRCTMLLLLLLLWQRASRGVASATGGGPPPGASSTSTSSSSGLIEIATGPRRELKPFYRGAGIRHFAPGCALLAGQFVKTRESNQESWRAHARMALLPSQWPTGPLSTSPISSSPARLAFDSETLNPQPLK